ncbi:FAEL177Cp [Eremothecium gossypii FDAG1]|nr:FAEL177Cp [Eremothecium gossypii FDAG1]
MMGEFKHPPQEKQKMSSTKKAGYSNPAFAAMGIPALRLPGPKWCAFWLVVGAGIAGVVYDKREQRRICKHYSSLVKDQGAAHMDTWLKPRRLTVFVAPPPGDYLETSMKVWRRYVKQVLFEAGLDYEVFTEERQGVIRHEVAERVRQLRRDIAAAEAAEQRALDEKRWLNRMRSWWRREKLSEEELERIRAQKFRDEFTYKQLLGVFYKNAPLREQKVWDADALVEDPVLAGGVICIGRGAYKEYIAGIHEGTLGPLDPPTLTPEAPTELSAAAEDLTQAPEQPEPSAAAEALKQAPEQAEHSPAEPDSAATDAPDEKSNNAPAPPPAPYVSPDEYSSLSLSQELVGDVRHPSSHIPALFHQPLLVIPVPNLSGFLQTPRKIYRFYTRRYYAEECCKAAAAMVLQTIRPFQPDDLNLGISEEEDWPRRWVEQGRERKSEWVQDLKADPRVIAELHVVDPALMADLAATTNLN